MSFRLLFSVFLFVLAGSSLRAQAPSSFSSSDIYQQIEKMKVLGSVLYIAAHPDDENTRLLTWLAQDQLLKTGYLSITRGDGGQNLIGDEQGVELGLIRTQELLAARRIDGAEQFFTRAFDFGYSKHTEEALRIWNKDKVLQDVVWVIRKFRPDVIITRFPPDNRAGHGHHSASAVLAEEAFRVAADPRAYPAQFRYGVEPWQAKRILWNRYNFGGVNTTSEDQMKIDAGGFNALIGKSYGALAAESRSQHKSQGFGAAASRGVQFEYFSHTAGAPSSTGLMEGVDRTWLRIGGAGIAAKIDAILERYDISDPSQSVPSLVDLYKEIEKLPGGYWKTVKLEELKGIIAAASGLWLEACSNRPEVKKGERLGVRASLNNREGVDLVIRQVSVGRVDTVVNRAAGLNLNIDLTLTVPVPDGTPVSGPYWLREKMDPGSYNVDDQLLIGKPDTDPAFQAIFTLVIAGHTFQYEVPVQYKYADPVKGEVYQPLLVRPPAAVASEYGRFRYISYPHIPDIYYFSRDSVHIDLQGLQIRGKKIGYIEGAGDKVPAALSLMGYEVTLLKEADLTPTALAQFDAVIAGVRAYNVHGFLAARNDVLNAYVAKGGNYIVQYNTNSNIGPNHASIGPYSFNISRGRVTDEGSPVRFLLPDHPVLNYPNRITAKDFDGWVQERGIYFADQLDPAFQTPLALKDPGEEEQKGSLIIAKHGKGQFVYTGLVFFRQLPAGVTGAYKLMANIIALNQTKGRK